MTMQRILLVGGAGYIGSHVNKLLNQKGYQTVIFDNLVYGHREFVKWGDFLDGDLAYPDQIHLCFSKYPVEAVVHLGAFAYVGESIVNPEKYYLNNVKNTLHLLQAMRKHDVKKIVFSSTCATYGDPGKIPMDESNPQCPINPYGRSKLMVEMILEDFHRAYGLEYVNLRYFNAAGADPDGEIGERHKPETHLIPLAIQAALGSREHLTIHGTDYETKDGTCLRDFVHVCDLANAHIRALEHLKNSHPCDSFNLGSDAGVSVLEVIAAVEKVSGSKIKVIKGPRRPGDPPILLSSSQKARRVLGWNPQYSDLETIVGTAFHWHKKDRGNL